jgi:hypothetical protein
MLTNEEKRKFYTPDGRINADVAFTAMREAMKTMSPEEFKKLALTPAPVRNQRSRKKT